MTIKENLAKGVALIGIGCAASGLVDNAYQTYDSSLRPGNTIEQLDRELKETAKNLNDPSLPVVKRVIYYQQLTGVLTKKTETLEKVNLRKGIDCALMGNGAGVALLAYGAGLHLQRRRLLKRPLH